MKFLDICAGIGGFRSGLEQAGHECVGYVEIDKYARASYEAMYDTKGEWNREDITKVRADELPRSDIWCFGFPCQDISIAGNRKGLNGSRSGIFYDIINLLQSQRTQDKPEWLLIENVKNLLSIGKGEGFTEVLTALDKAGYDCEWSLFNSKDFGVPQNRERVFIVCHLRERGRRQVLFESGESRQSVEKSHDTSINTIISGTHYQDYVQRSDGISRTLTARDYKDPQKIAVPKQIIPGNQAHRVYDSEGLSVTVKAEGGGVGAKTGLYTVPNNGYGIFDYHGKEYNIRRLTPKECFRLQGFSDEQFEKARKVNSDTQLYKQAGNAVTVNIAKYLGELIN